MSAELSPLLLEDEHDLYPIHEEDDVGEIDAHETQVRYVRNVLKNRFPDRYVGGNLCIYWERGNKRRYIAPDLFAAAGRPAKPKPRIYLLWTDPAVRFVLEVISRETARVVGKNRGIFHRHLQAPEVLEMDAERHHVVLWRREPTGYVAVAPEANGRLRSQELGLEFALDEEAFLWLYTLDGERLLTYDEISERANEEARRRTEAEARTREAEARAKELERQLAELQALRQDPIS